MIEAEKHTSQYPMFIHIVGGGNAIFSLP